MRLFVLILIVIMFMSCNRDRKEVSSSICSSYIKEEEILESAKNKMNKMNLNEVFDKSQFVVACCYEKYENKGHCYSLNGFLVTLVPMVALKGSLKTEKIYIFLHSPRMSGFGHEENYGKKFLIFLNHDRNNNMNKKGYYAQGVDFLRAIKFE